MKQIILLVFMVLISEVLSAEEFIERSDYGIPELEMTVDKHLLRNFRFKKNLNESLAFISNGLEEHSKSRRFSTSEMALTGFNTQFSLGLKGGFGVLSWGGENVGQVFWKKRNVKSNASDKVDITFHENPESEIGAYVEKLNMGREGFLTSLERDFIRDALLKKTRWMDQVAGAASATHPSGWHIDRILFDISLALEAGVPAALLTKLGGDLRIRFEWKKVKNKNASMVSPLKRDVKNILSFVASGVENSSKERRDLRDLGLELNHIRVEVSQAGKGKLGIFKGSAALSTYLYIRPPKVKSSAFESGLEGAVSFVVQENVGLHESVAEKFGVDFFRDGEKSIFHLSQKKLAKSFRKIFKFAKKLGKSVHEFSLKKRKAASEGAQKNWGIPKVRTTYVVSASGDIGAVTLAGNSSVELEFTNLNF